MGISDGLLNGNKITDASLLIPAWGTSYADVSLDVEVALSGAVQLSIADLAISGTVVSGGPAKGRSFYRIAAGAAGWGKAIPRRSYANDLGVKLATVLNDAAGEVGETIDQTTLDLTARLGPSFVRPAGPAKLLLQELSPSNWYVGEDGKTRLGQRPAGTLSATATRTSQVDLARGTVTLASDTIAAILPGIVVDGLTAVDVEHQLSAKGGLRSTLWAQQGAGRSRRLEAYRALFEALDPFRRFRGISEYRVVSQEGERLNLQPVRVSTGMPDLSRVSVRPGVPGLKAQYALGSRVLVGFVDADPARPAVVGAEDADGAGFSPVALFASAGGQAPVEHVATVEAVCAIVYNTLAALMAAAGGGPLLAATLQPLLAAAVGTAITTLAAPAPPGLAAQIAAAAAEAGNFASGTPASTAAPFAGPIASALAAKTNDVSGLFPSVGAAAFKAG